MARNDTPVSPRRAGRRPTAPLDTAVLVRVPSEREDSPRWWQVGLVGAVALAAGTLWPRACGLRFGAEGPEPTPAATGAPESASSETPPPMVTASSAPTLVPPTETTHALATVAVGKSTLIHCQDPPDAELKPSKCGDPLLDGVIMPKLEALSACPAAAGVVGRIALTVDVNFKTRATKLSTGRSSVKKNGQQNDKAIEPVVACARAALKDVYELAEGAGKRDHARWVIAYPLTIAAAPDSTSGTATGTPSGTPATVAAEKPASGAAKVTVDAALVRDAPNVGGTMVARLTRGTKVTIVGVAANWYHVKFGDGDAQDGWIFRTNVGR